MIADTNFTLPLVNYICDDLGLVNHRFLIVNFNQVCNFKESKNISLLKSPTSKNLFSNFFKFLIEVNKADKIIAHAAPLFFFFMILPWTIKKVIWPIHGGIDIPHSKNSKSFFGNLNFNFKKRIKFHATHVKEDSDLVNQRLGINAKFLYSPMYLSNVIKTIKNENDFIYNKGFTSSKILVGNSTDPSNQHAQIFEILKNNKMEPSKVYSILSYGRYDDYKNFVIKLGSILFGENFIPIIEFLDLQKYLNLLDQVDFVIFNHERQEAMGATIQLLSLGKPIFFNPKSPAFKSLKRRGYIVFSNEELVNFKNINTIDLSINRQLLIKEYSIDVLKSFYTNL
jgi:hypothetical protein